MDGDGPRHGPMPVGAGAGHRGGMTTPMKRASVVAGATGAALLVWAVTRGSDRRVLLPASGGRIERATAAAAVLERGNYDVIHDTGVGWYCDVLHPHNGAQAALVLINVHQG